MGIFDKFKEKVGVKSDVDVTKELAKKVIHAQLKAIQKSKETESLTMKREPSGENDCLTINVNYKGALKNAPLYAYYIVKSLANVAGISFQTMIDHMEVYNELIPEVSDREKETKINED